MVVAPESAVKKPDFYESKRIQLTSKILHIGSSVSKLNPFEYIHTPKKVYFPNQESLAKSLLKKGGSFLNDYIQAIENRQEITGLLKQAFGEEWWKARDTNDNPIFPQEAISQNFTQGKISDLRPMIRNGMGYLFIPGSSIKGAIRTAVAYHLLKYPDRYRVTQQYRRTSIEERLKKTLGELRNKQKQKLADDQLFMDGLFSNFDLKYQGEKLSGKSQNTDFLRCLKVSDSEPIIETRVTSKTGKKNPVNFCIVAEVIVSSKFSDNLAKYKASIYAEMVRNVNTEFTLTLDPEMLSWFQNKEEMKLPFNNLDELLQICQDFAQEQWDYEHDYWDAIKNHKNNAHASGKRLDFSFIREFYEPENCPYTLRLGWGSGMTGTTVGLCFDDDLRAELRDICGRPAPGFEAPKSRRTVMNSNGEIKWVPGWVKFKTLND